MLPRLNYTFSLFPLYISSLENDDVMLAAIFPHFSSTSLPKPGVHNIMKCLSFAQCWARKKNFFIYLNAQGPLLLSIFCYLQGNTPSPLPPFLYQSKRLHSWWEWDLLRPRMSWFSSSRIYYLTLCLCPVLENHILRQGTQEENFPDLSIFECLYFTITRA